MTKERLNNLIESVKAVKSQRGYNAREELIYEKWEIGECIIKEPEYIKSAKGSGEIIDAIAEALEMSTTDIHYCIQFFTEYPDGVSTAMEKLGMDASWTKIKEECLGAEKEEKIKEPRYKLSEVEKAFRNWIIKFNRSGNGVGQENFDLAETDIDIEWKKFSNLLK